ncbi:hypothetical protein M0R45_016646 [Rubus argutus]|uniref:non-specific serine/threonine protein kinase n=1 Tax=Rubus argutus TaxID=59490 RepID=A0AAW1XTQ7_RUBAR
MQKLENPEMAYNTIIGLVVRLAEHGLIHCDFNEFNVMVDHKDKVTMIDFPQMVLLIIEIYAQMYFDRDVNCTYLSMFQQEVSDSNSLFNMSFQECTADIDGTGGMPCFTSIARNTAFLDKELKAMKNEALHMYNIVMK